MLETFVDATALDWALAIGGAIVAAMTAYRVVMSWLA